MVVDGVAVKYSRYNATASSLLAFSGLDRAMTHPPFASSRYSYPFLPFTLYFFPQSKARLIPPFLFILL